MPKSVVFGGFRYLSQMSLAQRLDAGFQLLGRPLPAASASPLLLGLEQPLVILDGELGVDGQPDHLSCVVAAARQLDGKFHPLAAVLGGHVGGVLIRLEHLLEHGPKLHLAPGAAGLDVGEHLLEIAHAGGQDLHFAQALVDLFQAFADLLEGLAEPLLERALEFLVHGLPHLVELLGVVFLEALEPGFDGHTQLIELLLVGFGQLVQPGGEDVELGLLELAHLADVGHQRFVEVLELRAHFLAPAGPRWRFPRGSCRSLRAPPARRVRRPARPTGTTARRARDPGWLFA